MRLQDFQVSKCTSHVYIPFASSWSEDNVVAVVTEMGVNLMEVTPSPYNKSTNLDMRRYLVFASEVNPTYDIGIDVNELTHALCEEELYQVIQNTTLAPQIKGSRFTPTVKYVAWSPMRISPNNRSILTILTNSGGLDFYCLSCNKWKQILSISTQWGDICKSEWEEEVIDIAITPKSELIEKLKKRAYKLKITAFTWGQVHRGQTIWCPLYVATMDGTFLYWRVNQGSTNISVDLINVVTTDLEFVTALDCRFVNQTHYLLFSATLNGKIYTQVVCLYEKGETSALVGDNIETWPEEDRIEVSAGGMVSTDWSNQVLLAVVKGPHLLLLLNSLQGTAISNYVINSNNLAITGINFVSTNSLLITTSEGFIYGVSVNLDYNGLIQADFSVIESNIQCENYRCNGFSLSNSKALICLALSVEGNYDHLRLREHSQAVWCTLQELDDVIPIVDNHLGSLYDIWDIFELMRIMCLKKNWSDKILTVRNIEELDVMDVGNLKKNLWLVEIYLKLDSHSNDTRSSLETLKKEMTTLIMSSHVFKRVTQLMSGSGIETVLDRESLRIMRQWLYYLVNTGLKTAYTSTHATATTLLQQMDDNINEGSGEACVICGASVESVETISTSICVKRHSVPRCFISMVQCGVIPYYTCPVCKIVAHPSAVTSTTTCIFCDCYLRLDPRIISEEDVKREENSV